MEPAVPPAARRHGFMYVLCTLTTLICFARAKQVLRWSDEFRPGCQAGDKNCVNGGINLKNFGFELGDGTSYGPSLVGWGNAQLQCHTNSSDNIRVEPFENKTYDGYLVIQAARAPPGYSCYNQNAPPSTRLYTSARLVTRDKGYFRWKGLAGKSNPIRIDVRMQVPLVNGTWPAAWMLPQTNKKWCMACGPYGDGWCLGGEIVVSGHTNANKYFISNVQSGGQPQASWVDCKEKVGRFTASTTKAPDWNVMSLLWDSTYLRFLANGNEYHRVSLGEWRTGGSESPYAPFDVPFYFILDLAVGGTVPGFNIDEAAVARGAARYLVDYIRVYEMVP